MNLCKAVDLVPVAIILLVLHACATRVPAPVQSRTAGMQKQPPVTSSTAVREAATTGMHVVASGDTLYSIAWRYRHDYRDVARWNNIDKPYLIYPGQKIRLTPAQQPAPEKSLQPGPIVGADKTGSGAKKTVRKKTETDRTPSPAPAARTLVWQWPTRGKASASASAAGGRGVDFNGQPGQQIVAAAAGEVVYSGSGLLGYGKLIIIKHNDTYLSAYAYNRKILVREGERVSAGQQIATMGIGIKGLPTLHFEIRKNGKPTDPLKYLPSRET